MEIQKILIIAQIVACAILVVSVLLQNRAEGLGKMFGGGGEVSEPNEVWRKYCNYVTIALIVVLIVLSLLILKYSDRSLMKNPTPKHKIAPSR
jgi:protein translocase SecG subunit